MKVHLEEKDNKGKAFITIDNEKKAEMTYSKAGSKLLIINHTEVDKELQGQGIGRKMLDQIVDYARTNQFEIMPLCPFAKSIFDRDPSIGDVLNIRK